MTPDQEHLFRIFHPHAAKELDKAFSSGRRFVYYTRAETAAKILRDKQIWMRKSMCMNDFSEVDYGLQRIYEAYHNTEAGKEFQSVLDQLFNGLRAEVTKLFDECRWQLRTNTFIACFSHHKDEEDLLGRLSMWRAYGGINGVALVMNNAPFQAQELGEVLKVYSSPVAYLDPTRFANEFAEVVSNIKSEVEFLKQQGQEDLKARVFRMLAFAATCTKHPGFAEELEWRAIHWPWWLDSPHMKKEVEVIDGTPQLVCKLPIRDIPEEGLSGLTIPALIDRIIIGPTKYPVSTGEAILRLLEDAGVEEPITKVFLSNIPLRQ